MNNNIEIEVVAVSKNIEGKNALDVPNGTILKVISIPDGICPDMNTIVMRTNDYDRPFFTLKNGSNWGNQIEGYVFEVLDVKNIKIVLNS